MINQLVKLMVKFYLPEARQAKEKKKTDYRIIIYKKLFELIKSKHLKYISNTIKLLKELPNVEQKREEKQRFEKQLVQLKSIKKKQMKILALFVILSSLKISNLNILQKLTQINANNEQIEKQVKESELNMKFLQKVMKSNQYKQKLSQIGTLLDEINKKKHVTKQKNKERKAKKVLKKQSEKKNIFQQNSQDSPSILKKQGQEDGEEQEQEVCKDKNENGKNLVSTQLSSKAENKQIKIVQTPEEVDKRKERQNFWKKVNSKVNSVDPKTIEQDQQEQIDESRRTKRTQFIKKGRNKVKQQKQMKKEFWKQRKSRQPIVNQPKKEVTNRQKVENIHPSWLARQADQTKGCITSFQGKKILL